MIEAGRSNLRTIMPFIKVSYMRSKMRQPITTDVHKTHRKIAYFIAEITLPKLYTLK